MTTLSTPPAMASLPLLGNAPAFFDDPIALIERGYREHGRIFSLKLGTQPMAVLLGPANHKIFFDQTDKALSLREGYPFFAKMFGKQMYFMADHEEYREQRSIVMPAFQGKRMNGYVAEMEREAMDFIDGLGDRGEFELTSSLGPLVMNVASRAFLGREFRQALGGEFFEMFRDFSGGIDMILPLWLPLPRFQKSNRARRHLHDMLGTMIAERRRNPGSHDDFLQTLIESKYTNGAPLANETIINLILLFVWAGHETTAGHISWGLVQLLQHPEYLSAMLNEQQDVLHADAPLTMENARQLRRVEWALKETERTKPVAYILVRGASSDLEVGGYTIPKGWMVAVSPAISHRLPEVFQSPEKWDPERFSPSRNEDQNHALIGFGGGMHRCSGVHFAYLEMKIALSLLFKHLQMELVDPNPKTMRGTVTKWPASPTMIRYRRVQRAARAPSPRASESAKSASGCPFHHGATEMPAVAPGK